MRETPKSHRAAKTTIVGGQPPGNERELATVPAGLEELLGMAAVDPAFAEALMTDPGAAVEASGLELTPTEQAILGALDRASLEPLVAQVGQTLPEPERRGFLELAAAATVVLVGGTAALAGCKNKAKTSRGRKATPREQADTGARPDRPKVRRDAGVKPERRSPKVTTGIRPRRRRAPHPPTVTGINPDRIRPPEDD